MPDESMSDKAAIYSGVERIAQAEQPFMPAKQTPASLAASTKKGQASCEAQP
jgi:hypothetical protein